MARNLSCFLFKRSKGYESDLLQNAAFSQTSGSSWYNVDQNYVVTKILEKVEELEREEYAVLFLLDNVDALPQEKMKKGKT